MLDMEKIQAFLAVEKLRSFYKAAEELYITQPTLSYRLSALELEVGGHLFTRNRGNIAVEMTELGRNFTAIAKRLEKDYFDAMRVAALPPREELRISTVDSLTCVIVPSILELLLAEPKTFALNIDTDWYYDIYKKIQDFKLDLGFVTRYIHSDHVLIYPLYEEEMLLAHNASSVRYEKIYSPNALDPSDEVFLSYGDNFNAWHQTWFGVVGSPNIISDKFDLLSGMLSLRDYWAVVPSSVAQMLRKNPNITVKKMQSAPPNRTTYLLRNGADTPFLSRHWSQVVEMVNSYLKGAAEQHRFILKEPLKC